jgi:hypothetical protein
MKASELTVRLSPKSKNNLERFAKLHKTTVSEVIDRYGALLEPRKPRSIHPGVRKILGSIKGDIDFDELRYQALKEQFSL